MDFNGEARLAAPPDAIFAWVRELTTYPRWFSIVDRVEPEPGGSAWRVDLAARLGPLKRTKRVRMIAADVDEGQRRVRFERDEPGQGAHSAWVLGAEVVPEREGAKLLMHVHYGGVAWLPGIDLILRDEARRAGGRLERLVAGGDAPTS